MNVIKYTIRGERIKIKGPKKSCLNMTMICILAIGFVCFQLPFVTYNGKSGHFLETFKSSLEKDKSCWINWDKSQLKPQRVFDERSKNYKELDDGCWKVTQNESNFFDSINSWFQNQLSANGFLFQLTVVQLQVGTSNCFKCFKAEAFSTKTFTCSL